jgi:hypothetical protein
MHAVPVPKTFDGAELSKQLNVRFQRRFDTWNEAIKSYPNKKNTKHNNINKSLQQITHTQRPYNRIKKLPHKTKQRTIGKKSEKDSIFYSSTLFAAKNGKIIVDLLDKSTCS